VTPRAVGMIVRAAVATLAATAVAAVAFTGPASASTTKPTPKPTKPPALAVSITGPNIDKPIVIRSAENPSAYDDVVGLVAFMNGAAGNIMPTPAPALGPRYTVTTLSGTARTGIYQLYPLVAGGPRSFRVALGKQKAAWFYAPLTMASTLASAGVTFATSPVSGAATPPTIATSSAPEGLSQIMSQSRVALALATLAAAAVLFLLAMAAYRSRRADRRRAMPPAIARLETVANQARAPGSTARGGAMAQPLRVRGAVPAARVAGQSRATGTARVPSANGGPPSAGGAGSSTPNGSVAAGSIATGSVATGSARVPGGPNSGRIAPPTGAADTQNSGRPMGAATSAVTRSTGSAPVVPRSPGPTRGAYSGSAWFGRSSEAASSSVDGRSDGTRAPAPRNPADVPVEMLARAADGVPIDPVAAAPISPATSSAPADAHSDPAAVADRVGENAMESRDAGSVADPVVGEDAVPRTAPADNPRDRD
jgi:hypothetical protein